MLESPDISPLQLNELSVWRLSLHLVTSPLRYLADRVSVVAVDRGLDKAVAGCVAKRPGFEISTWSRLDL